MAKFKLKYVIYILGGPLRAVTRTLTFGDKNRYHLYELGDTGRRDRPSAASSREASAAFCQDIQCIRRESKYLNPHKF